MPYDGLTAYSVVKELSSQVTAKKINRIYQPTKFEIDLYLSDKQVILISVDPSLGRVCLFRGKKENPMNAPAFCMLLRKYLIGGVIKQIRQVDFDRIIIFEIETLSDSLGLMNTSLIVENMGRHSNVILVNRENGKILDALIHVTHLKSSVREVLPSKTYETPPQTKLNPLDFDETEALNMMSFLFDKPPDKRLISTFMGFSNQLSRYLGSLTSTDDSESCVALVKDFFEKLPDSLSPRIYADENGKFKDYAALDYNLDFPIILTYDKVSPAIEDYYASKVVVDFIDKRYSDYLKKLATAVNRESHKLDIRKMELEEATGFEREQELANLILSNIASIHKGDRVCVVTDFFNEDSPTIEIPLLEKLTPSQNAQSYFKRYTKRRNGVSMLVKLIEESENELYYLRSQYYYLKNAADTEVAGEIISELTAHGLFKKSSKKPIKKTSAIPVINYEVHDGYRVLVGRNDRQNDQLTLKDSMREDIWLHAKNIPGSHVILKTVNGNYSQDALLEAACIAAFHSSARDAEKVEVDYTFIKYLKKPSGSAPGRVIYTNQKTLFVAPKVPITSQSSL
jgi:predicted ribosome quality control (RQC) complex YloA/Tae2 family protein